MQENDLKYDPHDRRRENKSFAYDHQLDLEYQKKFQILKLGRK